MTIIFVHISRPLVNPCHSSIFDNALMFDLVLRLVFIQGKLVALVTYATISRRTQSESICNSEIHPDGDWRTATGSRFRGLYIDNSFSGQKWKWFCVDMFEPLPISILSASRQISIVVFGRFCVQSDINVKIFSTKEISFGYEEWQMWKWIAVYLLGNRYFRHLTNFLSPVYSRSIISCKGRWSSAFAISMN